MATFLSDEWFGKLRALKDEVGPVEVPAAYAGLTINLAIAQADGSTKAVSLKEGHFTPGAVDGASVTVRVPVDVAKKVFVELDADAGTQAFLGGQLQIDGDVARLAALQTAQPTATFQKLLEGIKQVTD